MFGDHVILKFVILYVILAFFFGIALATVLISLGALASLVNFFRQFNNPSKKKNKNKNG